MSLFEGVESIDSVRDLSNLEGIIYTFMTEDGRRDIEYKEYLDDMDLRDKINDITRYRLILGRTIFSYPAQYLIDHPKTKGMMSNFEEEQRKNPLRFFAPSGNAILDFINDFDNSLCILTAANRVGKTQSMLIKKLINTIKCDPTWEIFSKYGVKYRPFRAPKKLAFATYDLSFHRDTTLPMLLEWLPEKELGVYARDYKGKGAKQVNINNVPILPLTCGSQIYFTAMSQGQLPFEGNVKHDWGWDEQGLEAAFIGADARIATVVDGRHDFALTPHKVEGRPDTGAGSWISKVCSGEQTFGHTIGLYEAQIWDIPEWYYPEKSKEKEYYKWVEEPIKTMNEKRRREGQARFFGKWHESSGLVIDEWDSTIHVIDPFDIPPHWSLYRAFDHGDKHPSACLWGAVSPAGDLFLYRDYRRTGRVPSQGAQDVIEASGNKRKLIGNYQNPKNEQNYSKYEEVQCSESYQWTVFDARAFSTNSAGDGIKLSKLYAMAGLKMKQGSGKDSDHYVPILKEWFALDPDKKHFVTGELGAPRVYVFNTCQDFIKTIKRWVWVERKTKSSERLAKESPTKNDDDLADCVKLLIQGNPKFRGNARRSDNEYYDFLEDFEESRVKTNRIINKQTGY